MAETQFQWTQDTWEPAGTTDERRPSWSRERLAWLAVIIAAVLVFEVTADPAVTVSVGCLKFGWDEFRLAHWLKRTDPNRRRGSTCSQFYLAWGLWRISVVAVALAFVLVFAHGMIEKRVLGAPPVGIPPGFSSALLVALAGFTLSSMASCVAVISALRHRVKVWLGPEVRWAREENAWPPQSRARRGPSSNHTKLILLSALITVLMLCIILSVLPLSNAFPQQKMPPVVGMLLLMSVLIGCPILILVLLEILGKRMIAPTPEACWATVDDSRSPGSWHGS